jgi:hypothetical protein
MAGVTPFSTRAALRTAKILTIGSRRHGKPSKLDLDAEAAGRTAHGHQAWTMSESFELTNTDALTGLPK